jgi:hypothetical protein
LAGAGYAIDTSRSYNVYTNGIATLIVDNAAPYKFWSRHHHQRSQLHCNPSMREVAQLSFTTTSPL